MNDRAEKQLKSFIEKLEPRHQSLIRVVRKALRKRFPTANEIVDSVKVLEPLEIETLLSLAAAGAKAPLPARGCGTLIIRSASKRQRPQQQAR